MIPIVIGTTTRKRRFASCIASNCPDQRSV